MRIVTTFAAAILAVSASGAFAEEPAMEMDSSMGKIYTDMKDMTLYTFDKDEPGKSNCNDQCATNWPPLMAEASAMGEGEWTIIDRTDGSKQWAYKGKPVYLFVQDKKAGDMMGEGKADGAWHVLMADAM